MPVTLWIGKDETATPYGDQPGYEQTWHAMGSETSSDITTAAAAGLPGTLNGFPLIGVSQSHKGGGLWDLSVKYGLWNPTETLTGSIGGGTVHRTFSLQTIDIMSEGGIHEDLTTFGNLIGVDKDEVKGVDVPDSLFTFTIKKKFLAASLSAGYIADLRDLLKTPVNNAGVAYTWRGQNITAEAGALRFLGAEFSDGAANLNGSPYIEFTFKFEHSPNVTGLAIGDITGIDKEGWEYLWVKTVRASVNGIAVFVPKMVCVERVFEKGDFSVLGIFS